MAAVADSSALALPIAPPSDDVWAGIARGYAEFASPLVPCREDIGIYEKIAASHAIDVNRDGLDVLMLGVTPGIATMNWPECSRVLAVEISPDVIRALWPGNIRGAREVCCASWFDIPLELDSLDMIVGDGSLNACRYPDEVRTLGRSLSAALRTGGLLVARVYVRPNVLESIESVFDALLRPSGLKVDAFKMRLWLAMQRSALDGVAVRDAARILQAFGVDGRVMRQRLGWREPAIEPFERWRTSDAVYSFPSLDELRIALREHFEVISVTFPTYELGHCCPVVVMRSIRPDSVQGDS